MAKVRVPSESERLDYFAPEREVMEVGELRELIAPVTPDGLAHLGGGVYEACWSDGWEGAKGVVALCGVSRVVVVSERPYRPVGMPTGIAVRFCVQALPSQSSELVH